MKNMNNKMVVSTYLLTITMTLYANRLSAPRKGHRVAAWITTQDPYTCFVQEAHFRSKDTARLKLEGWRKMFHRNGNNNDTKNWVSNTYTRKNRP